MNMIKQLQLDELLKTQKVAIIFFQESHILDQTFENCPFIKSNFQLLINNSETGYGTSALIHNSLKIENVRTLPGGRILYFEINKTSFVNVYLPSGTAGKAEREAILADSLPNLLLDSCKTGIIGGDWNCIDSVKEATHLASFKVSLVLQRLGRIRQWRDLFRVLHPSKKSFSHVYRRNMGDHGPRTDGRSSPAGQNLCLGRPHMLQGRVLPSCLFRSHGPLCDHLLAGPLSSGRTTLSNLLQGQT